MTVVTSGGRHRDLGKLDPTCTAGWHGTYAAYRKAKCRCPHAREAHRVYQKRHREGRAVPALVDATGTRRRVQALRAIGHSAQTIADVAGERFTATRIARLCRQDVVTPLSRDLIAAAYSQLIHRRGASQRTREQAAAAGYPLPIQWGADIDDPGAVPEPLEPEARDVDLVDEVVVERALAGEWVELTDAELVVTLQAGVARGLSLTALSLRLGINYAAAKTIAAGGLTSAMAKRAERRRLSTAS